MDEGNKAGQLDLVREFASRLMHLHYCDNDFAGIVACFAPQFSWIGAGEDQYVSGREETAAFFQRFQGAIPKCNIWDEHYDVIEVAPNAYACSGMMWIATDPSSEMFLKVHQRVSFVFSRQDGRLLCNHIHCSNPYLELMEGELFPDKIGRQSFEYVQERIAQLEEETAQKNRQLEVIMASIPGGMKISRDDDTYSFAYVSKEAAALFGYTVEEFLEMSGGCAVGATYPPDLERSLRDCEACFRDGGSEYVLKYRVRCKDGSLKWILDSGKKSLDDKGEVQINSLYLDITKSEEDAREILRQQELLQSIYDTVPCGILRFTRKQGQYHIVSLNRAALDLFSYESEEACIADWRNGATGAVLEEDRPILMDSYAQLNQPGDTVSIQYRVRCSDGGIRWLSGTNMVVSSHKDHDVIQRIVFDVTESRRLQEQLDQEQEMYRVAMESSSDVLYEYRVDEDIFVSYEPRSGQNGQADILRMAIPDYKKNLWSSSIVHPDDIPSVIDNICEGRTELFEARLWPPSGKEYQWYQVTGKVIAAEGRPRRVVGTLRNIHHEKQTLSANIQELHMNQSALQAISGVYMAIYYIDLPADRYYAVRLPEYRSGLAIPRGGSLTNELAEYIRSYATGEDQDRMLRFCLPQSIGAHLKRVGDRTEAEFRRLLPQGESIWLRLEIQLISMEEDRPKNAVLTFRNVTEERQRELAHRKEEGKAKRALEEAYEAANRASLAKSDFLSRMSHDIRTPMNAIMGMAAIAGRNLSDEEKLGECLQKIQISSRHLLSLINEVLDMSKIESGSLQLNESAFELRRIIAATVGMVRAELDGRGQHLHVETGPFAHETVIGDSMRLQQILLNLLSNAVKYTPEQGHISLRVQERGASVNGVGCFEFIVEDDGIGMSEEFQKKLFRPFERAVDSRVNKIQGTGLGMAITKNLVQMMNGSIQVESRLNEGSRFTVTLYLKLAQCRDDPVDAEPEAPAFPSVAAFKKPLRILLVEDNDLNREIARELLEMSGLITEEAENGRQAVEMFRQSDPGFYRLILMDIQMPVMDGYEAARAIRALDRADAAEIPIIALTANAFAEDVRRTRLAGMNEHLTKPLEVSALMQAIKRWLE